MVALVTSGDKVVRTEMRMVAGSAVRARQRQTVDGSRYWTVEITSDDLEKLVGEVAKPVGAKSSKPHPLQKNVLGPKTVKSMEEVLSGIGSYYGGWVGCINFGVNGRVVTHHDAQTLLANHREALDAGLVWVKKKPSAVAAVPEPDPDPEHEAHVARCEHLRIWVEGTCKRAIDNDWVMPEIVMPLETKLKELYLRDAGVTIPVLVDRMLAEPGVVGAGSDIILEWLGQYMSDETYNDWQDAEVDNEWPDEMPEDEEDVVFRPE